MSSVFSTVINFNMLGLLQRFHRLHIQTVLESESDETTIKYPHVEAHKKKDGHSCTNICATHSVSLEDVAKSVEQACEKAKETVTELGMSDLLKKHQNWDKPPVCFLQCDEGFEDEDDQQEDEFAEDSVQEDTVDPEEVLSSISQLSNAKLIDDEMVNHLTSLHRASFQKVENSALPMYELQTSSSSKKLPNHKHCYFVDVECGGKTVFIHKTTAVWLLQEGERVSADRLFRVRSKQPFTTECKMKTAKPSTHLHPIVYSTIAVGDVCVFQIHMPDLNWKIGRVLHFANYLAKTKASQQYQGLCAKVSDKNIGVLCSWYALVDAASNKFSLSDNAVSHVHVSINNYLCTLPGGCFENTESVCTTNSIGKLNSESIKTLTMKTFHLTLNVMSGIQNIFHDCNSPGIPIQQKLVVSPDNTTKHETHYWTKCGSILLTKKDRQQIVNEKELTDLHINAFQNIARVQFPNVGGLHNTLLLHKTTLLLEDYEQSLQILHIKDRFHWASLQVIGKDIYLYDSLFTTASTETLKIVAQLIQSKQREFTIQIMNIKKQTNTVDCGLYSIAVLTSLLLGQDPTTVVYNDKELRSHLVKVLEAKMITLFPISQTRKFAKRVAKTEKCFVYCVCRLPDNGERMICCDKCEEWYHFKCVDVTLITDNNWYCTTCS